MKITLRLFVSTGLGLANLLCSICNCTFITDEESLRTNLLSNYNSKVKPSLKTEIAAGLILSSLNSLDIGSQSMSVVTTLTMIWFDPRLVWVPSSYGGLNALVTDPEDIWTPPVVIENALANIGVIGGKKKDGVPLRITNTGFIYWGPPLEITTSCEMAIAHYPFDTQSCTIVLILWTYLLSEMDISAEYIETTTLYTHNGEFDLVASNTFDSAITQSSQPNETFRKINFELTFRRKWQFYGQNLILPIVLNSILMNVVFMLPIESGEKMGYSLTVLLTYIVFLTWVTEILPPISTDTSILQVYLAIVLVMGFLATLLTTWVLHLYHTDPDKPMGTVYRVMACKLLVPFRTCIHCRRGKKTKAEDGNPVRETGLPHRTAKVDPTSARPSNSASKAAAIADDNRESHRFETSTRISLADRKRALVGFDEYDTEQGDATPPCTWQELAKLCDCFFMWTCAGTMTVLTTVVMCLLYANY